MYTGRARMPSHVPGFAWPPAPAGTTDGQPLGAALPQRPPAAHPSQLPATTVTRLASRLSHVVIEFADRCAKYAPNADSALQNDQGLGLARTAHNDRLFVFVTAGHLRG